MTRWVMSPCVLCSGARDVTALRRMFSECEGVAAWTWWKHAEAAHNQEAKKEINEVLGHDIPFDTPKPTRLIKRILQIATSPGDLVLGSFAGSGTTRHAVLKMNARDRRLGLWPDHGPADILSAEREEAGQDARADADGPEAHPPGRRFIVVEREPAIAKPTGQRPILQATASSWWRGRLLSPRGTPS